MYVVVTYTGIVKGQIPISCSDVIKVSCIFERRILPVQFTEPSTQHVNEKICKDWLTVEAYRWIAGYPPRIVRMLHLKALW